MASHRRGPRRPPPRPPPRRRLRGQSPRSNHDDVHGVLRLLESHAALQWLRIGGGLGGPLRGLPPGEDCAGKARARITMTYTAYSVSWNLTQRCNGFASEGASAAPSEASPQEK